MDYDFLNRDGEIMATVEAKTKEEAMSLYGLSDYYTLEENE